MGSKKPSMQKFDTMTPEQTEAQRKLFEQLLPQIEEIFGTSLAEEPTYAAGVEALLQQLSGFDPEQAAAVYEQTVSQPALQQFSEEIAPTIQERAIGSGAGRSSGVQRQIARAGEQLQQGLAAGKASTLQGAEQNALQRQLQAIGASLGYSQAPGQQLLQQLGLGFSGQPFGYIQQPGKEGPFSSLLSGFGSAAGQGFGSQVGKFNLFGK